MKTKVAFLFLAAFLLSGQSQAQMVSAWAVADANEIPALEKKGFNLFVLYILGLEDMTPADQNAAIQSFVNKLGTGSQIVISIQPWLRRNWYTGALAVNSCSYNNPPMQAVKGCPVVGKTSAGLEAFLQRWGYSPYRVPGAAKVYGFLLADDVQLTPFGECTAQPANALWQLEWFYGMIRNNAGGQRNGCNCDLAKNKKIIVTMPFNPAGQNNLPGYTSYHFYSQSKPDFGSNFPSSFFVPGHAFDIVAPYYYPHVFDDNDVNPQPVLPDEAIVNMNTVFPDMISMFPTSSTRMPILQSTGGSRSDSCGNMALEYDLRIQFDCMIANGLGVSDAGIMYFAADWLSGCNTLTDFNGNPLTTDANLYYKAAGVINGYVLNKPIGPQ